MADERLIDKMKRLGEGAAEHIRQSSPNPEDVWSDAFMLGRKRNYSDDESRAFADSEQKQFMRMMAPAQAYSF